PNAYNAAAAATRITSTTTMRRTGLFFLPTSAGAAAASFRRRAMALTVWPIFLSLRVSVTAAASSCAFEGGVTDFVPFDVFFESASLRPDVLDGGVSAAAGAGASAASTGGSALLSLTGRFKQDSVSGASVSGS